MIPFIIKVCGVTTVEDARISVEAGANAIGFNFYPQSPRYVSVDEAARIAETVTGNFLRVAVFVNPSLDQLSASPFAIAQVHGRLPASIPPRLRIWKAMAPSSRPTSDTPHEVEAYLLDTPSPRFGGTGLAFDWSEAAGFPARFILAGGLHSGNVEEAICIARPWGVDACSRIESSPGRKDPQKVKEFITAAHRGAAAQHTAAS